MRCHLTHPHTEHEWFPIVGDPAHPRVLHMLGQSVTCPGFTEEEGARW